MVRGMPIRTTQQASRVCLPVGIISFLSLSMLEDSFLSTNLLWVSGFKLRVPNSLASVDLACSFLKLWPESFQLPYSIISSPVLSVLTQDWLRDWFWLLLLLSSSQIAI